MIHIMGMDFARDSLADYLVLCWSDMLVSDG